MKVSRLNESKMDKHMHVSKIFIKTKHELIDAMKCEADRDSETGSNPNPMFCNIHMQEKKPIIINKGENRKKK